jgi:WD40 repeat protein
MYRLFSLSDAGVLTLTLTVPVHRCCVLRVAVFGPLTVSTSTDGELAMWRGELTEQSAWRSRPHQSGINCLALASHGTDAMLVSGGDDNRVSLSLISKDAVTTLWASDQGHAAQVTGEATKLSVLWFILIY